ncbi:MAG: D-TA family PLP-dependent enzyme [Tannerellaceae bacterium]|jgi:D-serine deaminase-like pyridoxal phosphate-dependent protein|nr:D-TA family PLP-dependent enzyme [Tannerellaceae bacterium]
MLELDFANSGTVDSPALVVYEDILRNNIREALRIADGDVDRLRPHVKTHKTLEVCEMLIAEGVTKFKCATIAEAEMLAIAGARDILLAYQPVGPKIERYLHLVLAYPQSRFACLIDSKMNAHILNTCFANSSFKANVYIDVNLGMNRSGVVPSRAWDLADIIKDLPYLRVRGVHGYDGHIHESDPAARQAAADVAYSKLTAASNAVEEILDYPLTKVIGGSPTFPIHIRRRDHNIECSPGTFVFWDCGYRLSYPDLPFACAAVVLCRVVSILDDHHVCIDLGYKSIASEMPMPRAYIRAVNKAVPISQNEEHMVLEVDDANRFGIGMIVYAFPEHICPTVALYETIYVVRNHELATTWRVIARDRYINI